MPRPWLLCAWLALAAPGPVLLPATSHAASKKDTQRAEQLNVEARAAFKAGLFDQAADLFLQVYDLVPTPTAVFNAARAREAGKRPVEAKALYELYLRIEKSPEGVQDASRRIAEIEAALQAETERRAAEEAATRKARDDAEAAARKARDEADAARKLAEAKAEADRKAAEQTASRPLAGVTLLPPTGVNTEDTVRAVQEVLVAAVAEAQAARVGAVHPVADYVQADLGRTLPGQCDFHCQLGVARSLGSAYAVTTALRSEPHPARPDLTQWRLRLVLWRTVDASDAGQVEVQSLTAPGLVQRGRRAVGDLWNSVRQLQAAPTPSVPSDLPGPGAAPGAFVERPRFVLETEPPGVLVTVNETEMGQTPLSVVLPQGSHRMRLQRAGHHARGGVLVVPATGRFRVAVVLPQLLAAEVLPPGQPMPPGSVPVATTPGQPGAAPAQPGGTAPSAGQAAAPTAPPGSPTAGAQQVPSAAGRPGAGVSGGTARPAPTGPAAAPVLATEPAPPARSRTGVQWGVVGLIEGAVAVSENADGRPSPDVAAGFGGFLHLGYADEPDEPPVATLALGARRFQYQGLSAPSSSIGPAATPHGMSYWAGLVLPRLSGLTGSVHYNDVGVDNGFDDFAYASWQLRIIAAKKVFYFALGVEGALTSNRLDGHDDEFGKAPWLRVALELGVNLGGVALSN